MAKTLSFYFMPPFVCAGIYKKIINLKLVVVEYLLAGSLRIKGLHYSIDW
jgi:hypothetical protein